MAKGFNRTPAAGGQGGMLQQLQRLQQQMAEAQEKLAQETVSATSGGGAVKVAFLRTSGVAVAFLAAILAGFAGLAGIAARMHAVYRWMLGEGEKPDCIA